MLQYLGEIENQTEAAECHCDNYMAAAKALQRGARGRRPFDQMFAAAQGILSAAAIVNQLIWIDTEPPRPKEYDYLSDEEWAELKLHAKARAKKLKKILKATDKSLIRSRTVRNSLEHVDQRLDIRLLFGPTVFADRTFGPANLIGVTGLDHTTTTFRRIDPETSEFWILSHKANLGDIVNEMHEMSQIAKARIQEIKHRNPGFLHIQGAIPMRGR